MAFPALQTSDTVTSSDSGSGTHTANVATNSNSGDLLVLYICVDGSRTISSGPSGWTAVGSHQEAAADLSGYIYAKKSSGSEASTVDFTTAGGFARTSHICHRFTDAEDPATTAPDVTFADDAGTDVDPPSHTPSGGAKDYNWVSGWFADAGETNSALPTGYGNETVSSEGLCSNCVTNKTENDSSDDPSSFTTSFGTFVAFTLAVHPPAGGPSTFYISPTGSVASAGAARRTTKAKTPAGTAAPTGAMVRKTKVTRAGSIVPSGVATLLRTARLAVAGTIGPVGTATRATKGAYAGSATPSGAMTRKATTGLTGTTSPVGIVVRKTLKVLAGSVTPTGDSTMRKFLGVFLSGVVTPTSNIVVKVSMSVSGLVGSAGAMVRKVSTSFAGSTAPVGVMLRMPKVLLAGVAGSAGTLARKVGVQLAGTVAAAGSIVRRVLKRLAGVVLPSGSADLEGGAEAIVPRSTPTTTVVVGGVSDLGYSDIYSDIYDVYDAGQGSTHLVTAAHHTTLVTAAHGFTSDSFAVPETTTVSVDDSTTTVGVS